MAVARIPQGRPADRQRGQKIRKVIQQGFKGLKPAPPGLTAKQVFSQFGPDMPRNAAAPPKVPGPTDVTGLPQNVLGHNQRAAALRGRLGGRKSADLRPSGQTGTPTPGSIVPGNPGAGAGAGGATPSYPPYPSPVNAGGKQTLPGTGAAAVRPIYRVPPGLQRAPGLIRVGRGRRRRRIPPLYGQTRFRPPLV